MQLQYVQIPLWSIVTGIDLESEIKQKSSNSSMVDSNITK